MTDEAVKARYSKNFLFPRLFCVQAFCFFSPPLPWTFFQISLFALGLMQQGNWQTNLCTCRYCYQKFLAGFIIISGSQLKHKVWSLSIVQVHFWLCPFSFKNGWLCCQCAGRKQELKDRKKAHELYLEVKSEVEKCLAYLKEKREKDPYRGIVPRLLYQASHSFTSEVPTFEIWFIISFKFELWEKRLPRNKDSIIHITTSVANSVFLVGERNRLPTIFVIQC